MEQTINVEGPGPYTFRTGSLPAIIESSGQTTKGTITAAAEFFKAKYVAGDKDSDEKRKFYFTDMLVVYNISSGELDFSENIATTEKGSNIKSSLVVNPDLNTLQINSQKTYTNQQLADVLKFNRLLFESSDECMNMVTKLKKFSATVTSEIINENDNQGNKKLMYAQKLAHELNLSFTLNCAIFVGVKNVSKFKVDIEFDIRDKSIEFWLTSVEMKEIMDQAKELIITEQLKPFIEKGVPCIQIG